MKKNYFQNQNFFPSQVTADTQQIFERKLLEFKNAIYASPNGGTYLVVQHSEAQLAYLKLLQIGAAEYPDEKARIDAILNGLSVRDYLLANILITGGDK